jgi:hypothetical protein
MIRGKTYIALALLLFLAAGQNISAQDGSMVNESGEKVSYMFVQEAASGTFIKSADGNYSLTLLDVVPYTMYFSDRPEQIAGFAPMEDFIAGFCWKYPNAALSLVDADENEDTVILTISKPLYDSKTRTLTYTAKILEDLVSDRFSYHISRADAAIPENFGRATLFIDDCRDSTVHCCHPEMGTVVCGDAPACAVVDCNCCWDRSILMCAPCRSNSYYIEKCKEKGGSSCDAIKGDNCIL